MKPQRGHFKTSRPEAKTHGNTDVIIRSFQSRDSHVVRNIFEQSMGEMLVPLFVTSCAKCSLWIVFIGACNAFKFCVVSLVLAALIFNPVCYINCFVAGLHIGFSRYIQTCLHTDLDNVESIYLCQKNSHMWVAELNGDIIGMVALVPGDDHEDSFGKPREAVGRLRRNGCFARVSSTRGS
ncbi:N-acetyltransferase 8 [Desmophyllum pertusum]|uniref:N-acetyltransferase 8 n=1 Tax=Desmophyllum pertusum TaxID=174260 RepID=A0A9W9YST8_9CNID|nr:N-acetyltransferase 8 [Desmophyllum pertusum]